MFRNRPPFSFSVGALVALLLGMMLSAALFLAARELEHDKARAAFEQQAESRIHAVRRGLHWSINELISVNQLFVTFGDVSREQFRQFTAPLLRRNPYIQAFNFHRIVADAERPQFEAEIRRHWPAFSITEQSGGRLVPAARRPHYRVVEYIEPLEGNEMALGFDAASYSFQTAAMQRAVESGKPAATGLLRLMQETGDQPGLLVLMPLYRAGAQLHDDAARWAALIGDTAAVFRIGDLVENALAADTPGDTAPLQLTLFLNEPAGTPALAYRSAGPAPAVRPPLLEWLFYDQPQPLAKTFEIAGRSWNMVVSAPPAAPISLWSGSVLLLVAGLLLSALAAFSLRSLSLRTRRVERLVRRRTAELRLANRRLNQDIAARVRAEKALQLRQRAIEASANAIVIVSAEAPDYPIEYVNPAFERNSGFPAADMLGKSVRAMQCDERDQQAIEEIRAALRERREGKTVLRNMRRDGSVYWNEFYLSPVVDDNGVVSHFVIAQYDITATKNYEAELEFQANYDILTGLANRSLLRDRLAQAIAYADRYDHAVCLIYIDLDQFKFINDALGHLAGDTLLRQIAERLKQGLREADTVARLNGDEFLLIFIDDRAQSTAVGIVQRIMQTVAKPLKLDDHELYLTCSVGIAVYPGDAIDAEALTKHAEIAMYRAKEMGRSTYQFYTPEMNERALERLRLESDLRGALERGEFLLHYQPQVDLHSGRVIGMEALVRWQHPQLGLVSPARFIGLAEETGLIVPLGAWVIRAACRQNKAWQDAGLPPLRVSVNLSARQFYQKELAQSIAAVLEETGLPPHCLGIELTESLVMADVEQAIEILQRLRAIGVQTSIDDFGTGYSSLSYLKRFPVDVLKIDQSFVRDITLDADDAAIVLSIISLAHNLKMGVIAEGVETAEQLDFLRCNGCNEIQGYHFSRPLPSDEFQQLLRDGKCLPPDMGMEVAGWRSVERRG